MSNRYPGTSRRLVTAVLAGMTAAAAGAAWAADPAPPEVIKPVWVQRPTLKQIVRAYPRDALNHGAAGTAVIGCRVADDGTLQTCAIEEQKPARYHFGDAGLKLASDFRMKARDEDGRRTAGVSVLIPIQFRLADDEHLDAPPRR
jgi:TonB family protein